MTGTKDRKYTLARHIGNLGNKKEGMLTLSNSLSSVSVEEYALVLLHNLSNLLDRLNRTNLVVDHHD